MNLLQTPVATRLVKTIIEEQFAYDQQACIEDRPRKEMARAQKDSVQKIHPLTFEGN